MSVPLSHALGLSAALFSLGLVGFLSRRNLVFMLISAEIMLNAAALAFVAAGAKWGQVDGQVMVLFILTMAAAELSVGLVLVQRLYRSFSTLETDLLDRLGGG